MKLLLIEDSYQLADRIISHISHTCTPTHAVSGSDGLAELAKAAYDMVILDLGLPDMPGLDVCRGIRSRGHRVPILILTGVSDIVSKVALLGAGADDYMTKPFNARELAARIDALSRRPPLSLAENRIIVGDLVLDSTARRVTRGGRPVELRRKEFDILEYLVRNRGRIVTREMILNNVWESDTTSWANTVDVHIKNLRDRIDRPFAIPLIKTAYGIGYRVEVPEGVTTERSTRHD